MPGRIQIKLGDLFDGTSDLIVLPCSTSGTITQFVYNRLRAFNIPIPKSGMKLGQIDIMPFTGAENFAQYVAYAVSVKNNFSNLSSIKNIGVELGKLTQENSAIRVIHAPLLGAGSGGLQSEHVIESLKEGFISVGNSDSTLIIHILNQLVFERVKNFFNGKRKVIIEPKKENQSEKHIRTFISYTRTDERHFNWIKTLATFLRDNGIDARIDIWHLKTGMDLPQFMTNELSLADKVIIISNKQYAEKADGRFGGVGWETMIIQGDISRLPPESTKYITIVKEDDLEKGLPTFLKTKYVIHWGSNQTEPINRQRLLNDLLNLEAVLPPLGVPPVSI